MHVYNAVYTIKRLCYFVLSCVHCIYITRQYVSELWNISLKFCYDMVARHSRFLGTKVPSEILRITYNRLKQSNWLVRSSPALCWVDVKHSCADWCPYCSVIWNLIITTESEVIRRGIPAYTTAVGWLGFSDEKIKKVCLLMNRSSECIV